MSMINNALSGALASQVALNTVSQNTANLSTPGYSRQGILLASLSPSKNTLSPGSGVGVTALLRFNDNYKDQQMWRSASSVGQFTQSQPYFTQLEQVMGSTTSGLSSGINGFFTALNASAADASSTPLRQAVVTAASAMAQTFNNINDVLNNQVVQIDQQRDAMIPSVNTALANIASLNAQISAGIGNTDVSALQDARDTAIDGLASQVSVDVLAQNDGSVSVSLKSGQPLVSGSTAGVLSDTLVAGVPTLNVNMFNTNYAVDAVKVGGEMGGLGDYQVNTLAPLQQSVQDLAQQIAGKFNDQQAAGFTLAGNAGTPLFSFTGSGASSSMQVADGFQVSDLAYSSDGTPGNSDNLQAMIGISSQSVTLTSVGSVIITDADAQLIGKLGIDSQQNKASLTNATTVRNQAVSDWQSTSGVNQDEEAANLLQYSNMYQANMKVISVANTVFQATLDMMG
jgi:flagellar hook-associated protein 1 FlgK